MKIFSLKNKKQFILVSLGTIFLIFLWEIFSIIINNNIYLPRIEEVYSSALGILNNKSFYYDIAFSIIRTSISFFVALLFSIILIAISKTIKGFDDFFRPINAIIKTIPTMVLVVLSLVWFDKDKTPYVVGSLIVFPILYGNINSAINKADYRLSSLCKVYDIKFSEKIKRIYIPVILFYLAENLVSAFSLAFKVVIAGEVHGQPKYGIGSSIQSAKANFDVSSIFAWIIIIAIISILFDLFSLFLHKKIEKWSGGYENYYR